MSYNNSENHRDELHPAHSAYIKDLPLNTAEYFIGTLDGLESETRRKMTGYAVWLLNGFSAQTFENNEEDYVAFKQNLRRLSGHSIVALIIVGIVHLTLSMAMESERAKLGFEGSGNRERKSFRKRRHTSLWAI